MSRPNYSLRLQPSLKSAAERAAAADGASLNQFINVAVAEKLAALDTAAFFQDRAQRGDREAFLAFLDQAGDAPPEEGDEVSPPKKGRALPSPLILACAPDARRERADIAEHRLDETRLCLAVGV
jgi:uncharacterized protein (DUF1778 family)